MPLFSFLKAFLKFITCGYTLLFYEIEIMSQPTMIEDKARVATRSDIEHIFSGRIAIAKNIQKRLKQGEVCIVAEGLRGFIWVNVKKAYLYDAWVCPDHRRKGYYTNMLQTAIAYLATIRIHKVSIAADCTNIASIRAIEKVGFKIKDVKHKQQTLREIFHFVMVSFYPFFLLDV